MKVNKALNENETVMHKREVYLNSNPTWRAASYVEKLILQIMASFSTWYNEAGEEVYCGIKNKWKKMAARNRE